MPHHVFLMSSFACCSWANFCTQHLVRNFSTLVTFAQGCCPEPPSLFHSTHQRRTRLARLVGCTCIYQKPLIRCGNFNGEEDRCDLVIAALLVCSIMPCSCYGCMHRTCVVCWTRSMMPEARRGRNAS